MKTIITIYELKKPPAKIVIQDPAIKAILEELVASTKMCEQQLIIRGFLKELDRDSKLIATLLTHFYITVDSKHPFRTTIPRIMRAKYSQGMIEQYFLGIQEYITEYILKPSPNYANIEALSSLVDMPQGIDVLNKNVDRVVNYCMAYFRKVFNDYKKANFVDETVQFPLYSIIKLFLCIVQKLKLEEYLFPSELLVFCYDILLDDQLCFDTRSNCGIVFIYLSHRPTDGELPMELSLLDKTEEEPHYNMLVLDVLFCENRVAQVAMYNGIIINSKTIVLNSYFTDQTIMMRKMLLGEFLCMRLLDCFNAGSVDIIVDITRVLLTLTRRAEIRDAIIYEGLLSFAIGSMDHSQDVVRHTVKGITVNMLKFTFGTKTELNDEIVEVVTKLVNKIFTDQNYHHLSTIAEGISTKFVLSLLPKLQESLMEKMSEPTVSLSICNTYIYLMTAHFKELVNIEEWTKLWVEKPSKCVLTNSQQNKHYVSIFTAAFKLCPTIFELITRAESINYTNFLQLDAIINCLRTCYKNNIPLSEPLISHPTRNKNIWRGLIGADILANLSTHSCLTVRTGVLALIVESQRSTEPFTSFEMQLLSRFYLYNSREEVASFRQDIGALYKKAFKRVLEQIDLLYRAQEKAKTRPYEDFDKDIAIKIELNENFASLFYDMNLQYAVHYDCSHNRRLLALEMLQFFYETYGHRKSILLLKPLHIKQLYSIMLDGKYDVVAAAVYKLLGMIPLELTKKHLHRNNHRANLHQCVTRAMSIQPSHVTSAGYMTCEAARYHSRDVIQAVDELLAAEDQTSVATLLRTALQSERDVEKVEHGAMAVVVYFITKIVRAVEGASETSREEAAVRYSFYGLLACIRMLISKYVIKEETSWKFLLKVLTPLLCIKINDLVSPVINNNAPEGYLPDSSSTNLEEDDCILNANNSQMICVYAWRSIKELSLLLGTICELCPEIPVLQGLFIQIGEYFYDLFLTAKHRGAYEQASVAFEQVCKRLWRYKIDGREWPEMKLAHIQHLIANQDETGVQKLCATRRSAGIPFLIQTILVTEKKEYASKYFTATMDYLTDITPTDSADKEVTRLHNMNLVRALFRHNALGTKVAGFVGNGMILVLQSLDNKSWAIRNSTGLLFASIMTRIFGVQRSSNPDTISPRNRMSYSVFVARHPALADYMVKLVDKIVKEEEERLLRNAVPPTESLNVDPSVEKEELQLTQAIWIILGRLHGCHIENHVNSYIKFLWLTLQNPSFQTRTLAVDVITSLISTKDLQTILNKSLAKVYKLVYAIEKNVLHGLLLLIHNLIDSPHFDLQALKIPLDRFIRNTQWIMVGAGRFVDYCSATEYLTLLTVCTSGKLKTALTPPTVYDCFKLLMYQMENPVCNPLTSRELTTAATSRYRIARTRCMVHLSCDSLWETYPEKFRFALQVNTYSLCDQHPQVAVFGMELVNGLEMTESMLSLKEECSDTKPIPQIQHCMYLSDAVYIHNSTRQLIAGMTVEQKIDAILWMRQLIRFQDLLFIVNQGFEGFVAVSLYAINNPLILNEKEMYNIFFQRLLLNSASDQFGDTKYYATAMETFASFILLVNQTELVHSTVTHCCVVYNNTNSTCIKFSICNILFKFLHIYTVDKERLITLKECGNFFTYWNLILDLLEDDDIEIRQYMTNFNSYVSNIDNKFNFCRIPEETIIAVFKYIIALFPRDIAIVFTLNRFVSAEFGRNRSGRNNTALNPNEKQTKFFKEESNYKYHEELPTRQISLKLLSDLLTSIPLVPKDDTSVFPGERLLLIATELKSLVTAHYIPFYSFDTQLLSTALTHIITHLEGADIFKLTFMKDLEVWIVTICQSIQLDARGQKIDKDNLIAEVDDSINLAELLATMDCDDSTESIETEEQQCLRGQEIAFLSELSEAEEDPLDEESYVTTSLDDTTTTTESVNTTMESTVTSQDDSNLTAAGDLSRGDALPSDGSHGDKSRGGERKGANGQKKATNGQKIAANVDLCKIEHNNSTEMSKRRRTSSLASRGQEDDSLDSIEASTSASGPTMRKRQKKQDPMELVQQVYEAVRSFKKEDGSLLCDAFIRVPKRRQEPGYYEVVSNPIDLIKVQQKLKTDEYEDIDELQSDIELIVKNAKAFYKRNSQEYKDACDLMDLFNLKKARIIDGKPEVVIENDVKRKSGQRGRPPGRKSLNNLNDSRKLNELNDHHSEDTSESSTTLDEDHMSQYEDFFTKIMTATDTENRPLHTQFQLLPSKKKYPKYYQVIDNPIDLRTIATKIQSSHYTTLAEMERDLLTLTRNACQFNEPGSQIYRSAKTLRRVVTSKRQELERVSQQQHNGNSVSSRVSGGGGAASGKSSERIRNRKMRAGANTSLSAITAALRDDEEEEEEDSSEEEEEESEEEDGEESEEGEDEGGGGGEESAEEESSNHSEPDNPKWKLFDAVRSVAHPTTGACLSDPFWRLPNRRYYPDYYKEIKNPVSLTQIRRKLMKRLYGTLSEVAGDLTILFENAKKYNIATSKLYKDAVKLQKVMQLKVQELLDIDQVTLRNTNKNLKDTDSDLEIEVKKRGPKPKNHVPTPPLRGRPPKEHVSLKKRLHTIAKYLLDYKKSDGRQPLLAFVEKPSKKLYPDYYDVIRDPIDFLDIESKIKGEQYGSEAEMMRDFKIMFANCRKYNETNSPIYEDAILLEKVLVEKAGVTFSPTPEKKIITRVNKPRRILTPVGKRCKTLFEIIRDYREPKGNRQLSSIFMKLPSKSDYPDYYEVIPHPIDLERISHRVKASHYPTLDSLTSDLILMLDNACTFNEPDSQIYKDALVLQHLCLQTRRGLEEAVGGVPSVQAAVQEVLMEVFTRVYNHQDGVGRCYVDSLSECREHDVVDGKRIRGLSLDLIKRRLDRGLYHRLDTFQEDVFACLARARRLSPINSLLYSDSLALQTHFIRVRDELCTAGSASGDVVLQSPASLVTEAHVTAMVELERVERENSGELELELEELEDREELDEQEDDGKSKDGDGEGKSKDGDCEESGVKKRRNSDKVDETKSEEFKICKEELVGETKNDGSIKIGDCTKASDDFTKVSDDFTKVVVDEKSDKLLQDSKTTIKQLEESSNSSNNNSGNNALMRNSLSNNINNSNKCEEDDEGETTRSSEDSSSLGALMLSGIKVEPGGVIGTKGLGGVVVVVAAGGDKMTCNQQTFQVGDFVYLEAKERGCEPHILHIDRLWTNSGEQMLYGNYYLRPDETYHLTTRKFLDRELFKSDTHIAVPLAEVKERCCVINVKQYYTMRPEGFDDKDVYLSESRYSTRTRSFKKIKVFPDSPNVKLVPRDVPIEPKRVISVFRERVEKHKDELAELQEIEQFVDKDQPNVISQTSNEINDGNTYYEQYNTVCNGVVRTGDFVYVITDGGKQTIAQIDSIWDTKDGKCYFRGPWFVTPSEIPHNPTSMFYKQEVFLSMSEDTHPLVSVIGKCSVLDYSEFVSSRITEIAETDVYICNSMYDELNRQVKKLPSEGLKKYKHSNAVREDEIYYFTKLINPVKEGEGKVSRKIFDVKGARDDIEASPLLLKLNDMDVLMEDSLDGGPPSVGSGEVASVVPVTPGASTLTSTPVTAKKKPNKTKLVTGYILYSREVRKGVVQNHPESGFGEISKIVGNDWRALPAGVKLAWEEKAVRLNEETKAFLLDEQCNSPAPIPPVDQIFECLWDNCDFQFEEISDCLEHCIKDKESGGGHVQSYFIANSDSELNCFWRGCGRQNKKNVQPFPNIARLTRHVRDMHINKGNGRSVAPDSRSKNFKPSSKLQTVRATPTATPAPSPVPVATPAPKQHEPMFITVPPRPQRALHSEAYIKYIEGLQAENKYISPWERTLSVTQEQVVAPDPEKLQSVVTWLGAKATNQQQDNVVNALWTLRNQLLKDALGLQKTL